jgi:hypothetical protein
MTGPFGGQFGGTPEAVPPLTGHQVPLSPGHDPFASQQVHNQIVSMGHDPVTSFGHDPFTSTQHDQFLSGRHDAFTSSGHNPLFSWHDPFLSQGHEPGFSWHHPVVSGHQPIISRHNPVLSNPHSPILSRQHWLIPSWILTDPPVIGPTGPTHQAVPSAMVGPALPITDPTLPVSPGGSLTETVDPETEQGGTPALPEGLERVPGNRAGTAFPGMMPGDPYTVPQQ